MNCLCLPWFLFEAGFFLKAMFLCFIWWFPKQKHVVKQWGMSTHAIHVAWVYCAVIYYAGNQPWTGVYTCSHLEADLLLMEVSCSRPLPSLLCPPTAARWILKFQTQQPWWEGHSKKQPHVVLPNYLYFWPRTESPQGHIWICMVVQYVAPWTHLQHHIPHNLVFSALQGRIAQACAAPFFVSCGGFLLLDIKKILRKKKKTRAVHTQAACATEKWSWATWTPASAAGQAPASRITVAAASGGPQHPR